MPNEPDSQSQAPLVYGRQAAQHIIGVGPTKFYELVKSGDLDARKIGSKTVVTAESIRLFVANLPRAGR
jgi:hypothetical protein